MSADPRGSKHYKSCRRFEIKSTQPESQIYVTTERYLSAIILSRFNKLTSVFHKSVLLLNIAKVAVNSRGDSRVDPQSTLTML